MKYSYYVIEDGKSVRRINRGVWIRSEKDFIEFIEEIGFKRISGVMNGGIYYELKEGVPLYVLIDGSGGKLVDNKSVGIFYKYKIYNIDEEGDFEEVLGVYELEEFLRKIREEWDKNNIIEK